MEKLADMYVSTLRNFIQAMGGQLQVKAIFPEGEVQIDQFENVAEPHSPRTGTIRLDGLGPTLTLMANSRRLELERGEV